MAGNSFDVGERKTYEVRNTKPLASNDALEGFHKTTRESLSDRAKANGGVRLDKATSTPQQNKEPAPEPEKQEVEQPTPVDFSDNTVSHHHDWFEWVKQFRGIDVKPVTRINGRAVVPSVKKAVAHFARLGTFEQRIMLDALELMTKEEHYVVLNSYMESFATDRNEGSYNNADDEDTQQYAQQLAQSQQRERELEATVDNLQAELVDIRTRIEQEETKAQVDAGLKNTAADPHRDEDTAPVIDGVEEASADKQDEPESHESHDEATEATRDDNEAEGSTSDDEPFVIDGEEDEAATEEESSDADAVDDEDSELDGFDDHAAELGAGADPEEAAAIAAHSAQQQQKAEAAAEAEAALQQKAEEAEQAEDSGEE